MGSSWGRGLLFHWLEERDEPRGEPGRRAVGAMISIIIIITISIIHNDTDINNNIIIDYNTNSDSA